MYLNVYADCKKKIMKFVFPKFKSLNYMYFIELTSMLTVRLVESIKRDT